MNIDGVKSYGLQKTEFGWWRVFYTLHRNNIEYQSVWATSEEAKKHIVEMFGEDALLMLFGVKK